jgi:hypothetical protein
MFRSIAVSFRVLSKNTSLSPSNINLKLTPLTAKKYQVEFYEIYFLLAKKTSLSGGVLVRPGGIPTLNLESLRKQG